MVINLTELLGLAKQKGISDREIAAITGRNYSTVWRWRNRPGMRCVFDEGIERLVEKLNE